MMSPLVRNGIRHGLAHWTMSKSSASALLARALAPSFRKSLIWFVGCADARPYRSEVVEQIGPEQYAAGYLCDGLR